MKAIFEEYSGIIITVIVIAALSAILYVLLKNDPNGVVMKQLSNIVETMGNKATNAAGGGDGGVFIRGFIPFM